MDLKGLRVLPTPDAPEEQERMLWIVNQHVNHGEHLSLHQIYHPLCFCHPGGVSTTERCRAFLRRAFTLSGGVVFGFGTTAEPNARTSSVTVISGD